MDRERLRKIQAPLKERNREEPESAVVTLAADGDLGAGISCPVASGRAVATSLGIEVAGGRGHAGGEIDFRGTLAVDRDAAVGLSAIRLSFELDTDADTDAERLDALLKLTERYCVDFQTLARPPLLSASAR